MPAPRIFPSSRLETDAIVSALAGTGLSVGDGEAPAGSPPYLVLYVISPTYDGPAQDAQADVYTTVQVTAVGDTREQAEWARDKARVTMAAGISPPAGRSSLQPIRLLDGGGVQRDDNVQPPLFYAVDEYEAATTPV